MRRLALLLVVAGLVGFTFAWIKGCRVNVTNKTENTSPTPTPTPEVEVEVEEPEATPSPTPQPEGNVMHGSVGDAKRIHPFVSPTCSGDVNWKCDSMGVPAHSNNHTCNKALIIAEYKEGLFEGASIKEAHTSNCLLYTSPSPRD